MLACRYTPGLFKEGWNTLVRRTRIEFRDDASLRKAWDEALAAHEADIRNFAAKAAEQGFTASGLHLTIVLELRDQRRTSGPTPPLTPREFVLE